jgi:hypothetical protein
VPAVVSIPESRHFSFAVNTGTQNHNFRLIPVEINQFVSIITKIFTIFPHKH